MEGLAGIVAGLDRMGRINRLKWSGPKELGGMGRAGGDGPEGLYFERVGRARPEEV